MITLAKPALDVGLYTNQIDACLAFWQGNARVPFDHLLKLGGGVHQHRHQIGDSVLKINHPREPIPTGQPTGLGALTLYQPERTTEQTLTDPDGNRVTLAPLDTANPHNLKLTLHTGDVPAQQHFYAHVLGLEAQDDHSFKVGQSLIELVPGTVGQFDREGIGYRYMTVQVFDVVAEHERMLSLGAAEGMAPVRLGDVAYISFVKDADGNWIEISQRKSITGSLA